MSETWARLPLPLRLFNHTTAALRRVGLPLLSFDIDSLHARARSNTGLTDFGPGYYRDPLQRLCTSLDDDAALTALGRVMARAELLRLLESRLQLVDAFKLHPEIAEQEIIAPIFILGMPRTGTTSMHELMALDPQLRAPVSWEVQYPFPPPGEDIASEQERVARVEAELGRVNSLLPEFKHMHPMGATLPQECVALFSRDFASMIFDVQFRLTGYQRWLEDADLAEVYRNHRRWLQLLQWRRGPARWVLKTPQHLWHFENMIREYPDAQLLMTHRDPLRVTNSVSSLTATLRSLGSDDIELESIARGYAESMAKALARTMEARAGGLIAEGRILDIQFGNFIRDPLTCMDRVYEHLGLPFGSDTRKLMADFLGAGKESERHGKHSYRFTDTGLVEAEERARFAAYQAHFHVADEPL